MWWYAVILGITQGITELFPVSSSGHLVLLPWIFDVTDQGLAVDAALHFATGFAILLYFRRDWWAMIKNFRKSKLLRKIIVASIPAALMGIFLGDLIEAYLRSAWVVVVMLVVVAGLMLWVERNYTQVKVVTQKNKRKKQTSEPDWLQSVIIGFAQVFALIPGTSRSGITIVAGMWQNLPRVNAAKFSFMLGVPVTIGAGLLKIPEVIQSSSTDWGFVILAATFAFVTAWFAIDWLLRFLQDRSLHVFVWYRIGLAIITAGLLLI